jgi:hypothetical protein
VRNKNVFSRNTRGKLSLGDVMVKKALRGHTGKDNRSQHR